MQNSLSILVCRHSRYLYSTYSLPFDLDEIEQMDNDLKANGWGVKLVLEIKNEFDLLCIFQMFYYCSGRLPLTIGLLVVPDAEAPQRSKKTSLKSLHEMFKDTKLHGLVSLQFLCAMDIFFGSDISLSKDALTKLYYNLSFKTLSGGRNISFEEFQTSQ